MDNGKLILVCYSKTQEIIAGNVQQKSCIYHETLGKKNSCCKTDSSVSFCILFKPSGVLGTSQKKKNFRKWPAIKQSDWGE